MKISILLYRSGTREEKKLEKALFSAGFRVCTIGNLSQLHTILGSRSFDAIFVARKTLLCYCMNATRHLWAVRSPHTIIDWQVNGDGSIALAIHRISAAITGIAEPADTTVRLAEITAAITRANLHDELSVPDRTASRIGADTPEKAPEAASAPCYEPCNFPPDLILPLHAKIRLVLEAIGETGQDGADIPAITKKVWGTQLRDRKKDIQIYISKLRGHLSVTENKRYAITYRNKRYFLCDGQRRQ